MFVTNQIPSFIPSASVWLVDSCYTNLHGSEILERREVFTDEDSARLYAQLLAKRSNAYWRFVVFQADFKRPCCAVAYKNQKTQGE